MGIWINQKYPKFPHYLLAKLVEMGPSLRELVTYKKLKIETRKYILTIISSRIFH